MVAHRTCRAVVAATLTGFAASLICASVARAEPQRVVSLNLCTDQLVVDLVPAERIAAVTKLATDGLSTPAPERARDLPVTLATAEDVIARRADLVLASPFTQPATLELLRRTGHAVVTVGAAQTVAGVKDAIRKAAAAVGSEARGEMLIGGIDAAIARNRPAGLTRPTVVVLQPNNLTGDRVGLVPELLELTGFSNHGVAPGGGSSGRVEIETLVVHPPDVLILSSAPGDFATVVSDNLRHPALAALGQRIPVEVVPWRGWLCGTHHIAGVIDQLGALYRRVTSGGSGG